MTNNDSQNKNFESSVVTPRLWLYVILIFGAMVLGIGMVRGESSVATYFELKESQKILTHAVNELDTENQKLSLEITKIKQSSSYARKVLRDKYHVTDPNERIIFVED